MLKDYNDYIKIATNVFNKQFAGFKKFKEDLIQEGICALIEKESNFDFSRGSFSTFSYIVCRNAMAQFLRKERKVYLDIPLDSVSEFLSYEIDSTFKLDKLSDLKDLKRIAKESFSKLDSKCKTIMSLHLMGLKQNEIAEKMNINQSVVSRAIKKVVLANKQSALELGVL